MATETDKDKETAPNVDIDLFNAFDITIDLCKEAYEPQTSGKDFLEGEFPVIFRKIGNTLYVAFRGTKNDFSSLQSSLESIRNMIIDCSVGDILGEDTSLAEFPVFKSRLNDSSLTGHAGFMKELSKYYLDILEKIKSYYNFASKVVFTGHSAGGALATLMYYIYIRDDKIEERLPVYYSITYGSPRVIRDSINNKELYTKYCPNLFRCFNANDIVTYIPFNKESEYLGTMGSGFTHVGLPLPMDTNIEKNSLNALLLQVLRGNKEVFSEIFTKYTFDELRDNEIIGLLTSDNYLGLMGNTMFQCYQKVGVGEEVTNEMIVSQTSKILSESQDILDYSLKCDLAQPLGIAEILQENNIFTSEIQEDVGVSGIYGSLMKYNKLGVEAHDLKLYRENANLFEKRELETGTTPYSKDKEKTYDLPPVPVPVTASTLYSDLVNRMVEDISNGSLVGAIEIDQNDLPAIIEY